MIRRSLLPLSLILSFAACQEQDVHVYRIAKEHSESSVAKSVLAQAGPMLPGAQAVGELTWQVPASWQTLPASGMRVASFAFKNRSGSAADVSVVSLPGMTGGNLANVNRWRGQLGLAPLDERGMAANSKKVKSQAGQLLVVDFVGRDPKGEIPGKARMLGAILTLSDKQWFFKVMGQSPIVAEAKPSFLQFVRSLKREPNS